ncbi:MAG: pyridoxal-phosphate dependent enzyme [Chitinophagales bacterium]
MEIPVSHIHLSGVACDVLHLEKAFPNGEGNKYFKLKYNLVEARNTGKDTILSFGGAFSNHIHALAVEGKENGFNTIGVIRGEEDPDNPTLQFARAMGMQLHFISREKYRQKQDEIFRKELQEKFGDVYFLPEGGTNAYAVKGCSEILRGLEDAFDVIYCAVGTGGTLAGLISTPGLRAKIIGIPVLHGEDILEADVRRLLEDQEMHNANWELATGNHFGGYAKHTPELIAAMRRWKTEYDLITDPVYTGKVFFAAEQLLQQNISLQNKKIAILHTGGFQGIAGWEYRFGSLFT